MSAFAPKKFLREEEKHVTENVIMRFTSLTITGLTLFTVHILQ